MFDHEWEWTCISFWVLVWRSQTLSPVLRETIGELYTYSFPLVYLCATAEAYTVLFSSRGLCTMSFCFTEKKVYNKAALKSLVTWTEAEISKHYLIFYWAFYEIIYKKLQVPRFWILLVQCTPGCFPSACGPFPARVFCAARPGYKATTASVLLAYIHLINH